MIENTKKVFGRTIAAILLACLLGAIVYYSPNGNVMPKPAFAFVWAAGEDSTAESENNVCLEHALFEVKFHFANGTRVSIPATFPPYLSPGPNDPETLLPEYHGEIDATSLTAIGARFIPFGASGLGDATATMKIHENRFVNVHLVSGGVTTGMGTHEYLNDIWNYWFNQTYSSASGGNPCENSTSPCENSTNTGCFAERYHTNVPTWNITVNRLSQMLPYTGTATIEFHTSLEINVHYNITVNGDTKTGDTRLTWSGILGAYQLNLDQGRILSVKFDFVSAFLFLEIEK